MPETSQPLTTSAFTRKARIVAIFAIIAMVLAACGMSKRSDKPAGPRTGKYGDNSLLADKSPTAAATGEAPAAQPGGSKPRSGATQPKSGSTTAASGGSAALSITDDGGLGGAGRLILAPQPYTQILIEIDQVTGRAPTEQAIAYLVDTLKQVTGKEVLVVGRNTIPAKGGNYTGQKIVDISKDRTYESEKPKAAIWVGYLDGTMKGGGAAGVAVAGTVAAVFPDSFRDLPFPPTTIAAIERTVLVQEVGHLLGLVNITYQSPRDHEDKQNPNHSKNTKSVMYWALMTREGLIDFLANGAAPPDKFDADDLADLRDLANGTL